MNQGQHVNIDGDVICYAAGFASQANEFHVEGDVFETKKEAEKFCDQYQLEHDIIDKRIIPEPIEFCLSTVKRMVKNIMDKSGSTSYTVVLSGANNFRVSAATIQGYKANRSGTDKPIHYNAIRTYITEVLQHVVVDGEEADDYLSYRAVSHNETIATIDKDLDNTSGWHYNWNCGRLYHVSERDADAHFWVQVLTGDPTDNIAGLYRLTGSKASKAMKLEVQDAYDYKAMRKVVLETYARAFEKLANQMEVDYVTDEELHRIVSETGLLLWMRRQPDEMWSTAWQ